MWDEAIAAATEGAKGTAADRASGALDRGRKANHLMGSAELVQGAPVAEVALWAGATKLLVLGFAHARVDEQLKVDRAPIRAPAKVAVKARRAFGKAAKQATQQGGSCPPAGMPGLGSGAAVPKRPPPLGLLACSCRDPFTNTPALVWSRQGR